MEYDILNDVEPSVDVVRYWAYREHVLLIEQDEDLILGDVKYFPLLLELAADPSCPKAKYCLAIMEQYCRFVLEWHHRHLVEPIVTLAEKALSSPNAEIRDWAVRFQKSTAALN